MFTASLVVMLEDEGFVEYNSALDLVVLQRPASSASSESSTATSTKSSFTSSQSGEESKGSEEQDAESDDKVSSMLANFTAWHKKIYASPRGSPSEVAVSNVEALTAGHAPRVADAAISALRPGTGDMVEAPSRVAPSPPASPAAARFPQPPTSGSPVLTSGAVAQVRATVLQPSRETIGVYGDTMCPDSISGGTPRLPRVFPAAGPVQAIVRRLS